MNTADPIPDFLAILKSSLSNGTFVKLTLGKYRGPEQLKQIRIAPVVIRDQTLLRLVFQHATQDVTKNVPPAEGLELIAQRLGSDFYSGHLFTTTQDYALVFNKKKQPRLTSSAATFARPASTEHNRQKAYLIDPSREFLLHLGVTTPQGMVKPTMSGKFKQICRYVEIIASLLEASALRTKPEIHVTDIGSGKGYLTFALYDYLTGRENKAAVVRGIEQRTELAQLCNEVAAKVGYANLSFAGESAEDAKLSTTDLLIALHACDTATDDAIFQGIQAQSTVIVCAPCCQHEVAPQLQPTSAGIAAITNFGLFKQRQADLITDAARAWLMQACGYQVKVFEFISTEHTAKNVMLAAVRNDHIDRAAARAQYDALRQLFGFQTHRLEALLGDKLP